MKTGATGRAETPWSLRIKHISFELSAKIGFSPASVKA
jgi:hypothetical protein